MLLNKIREFTQNSGNLSTVALGDFSFLYKQLWDFSDKLAFYIQKNLKNLDLQQLEHYFYLVFYNNQ